MLAAVTRNYSLLIYGIESTGVVWLRFSAWSHEAGDQESPAGQLPAAGLGVPAPCVHFLEKSTFPVDTRVRALHPAFCLIQGLLFQFPRSVS